MFQSYNPNQNNMFMNNNNNLNAYNNNFNNVNNSFYSNKFGNSLALGTHHNMNISISNKYDQQNNLGLNYEVDIDIQKTTRDLVYIGSNKDKFDQYMKKLNKSILGDDELERVQEDCFKFQQSTNSQIGAFNK